MGFTLGFLQPSGLLMDSWRNPGLQSQLCELTLDARCVRWTCVHAAIANIFALLDGKKLPQEQILRPAALHTTGECESRETRLHTNIPISRAPLNYAGERESPISLSTQQQHLMACVAVIRVTVHFVDTVAISACIGLTVINVPGHLFSGQHFQSKRSWKLPGTFEPRGLEF